MNDPKHKIFNSTDCIPQQTMFDYIDNKLNAKERHVVEKHLLDCEFCSDALEGLELLKDRNRLTIIDQKVNERIAPATDKKIITINYRTITAVAAGLALLIGSIFFFNQFTSNEMKEKSIADVKKPADELLKISSDTTARADSTFTEIQLKTNDAAKPLAYTTEQKPLSVNKINGFSEAEGIGNSSSAGATATAPEQTISNNVETVVTNQQLKKSGDYKKEEKSASPVKTYSWTAPAPQKNEEIISAKEKTIASGANGKKSRTKGYSADTLQNNTDQDDKDLTTVQLNTLNKTTEDDLVYSIVDEMPEFPGGSAEMMKFISKNYNYTIANKDTSVTNTKIIIQFVVDKNGKIKDAKIVKGINPEYDKEALRVINIMPKWKPGKQKGQTVSVKYNLPVQLELK